MAKAAATTTSQPKTIWNYLYAEIKNKYGVAGLMGNLYAESALLSINVQNGYGYDDISYTNKVDNGTYKNFVNDSIGYGLAQWTYSSRKSNLKSYANQKNASIGNLEMQLGFLVKELKGSYSSVWNTLKSAKSVKAASNAVLLKFERPANSGTSVQNQRAEYGEKYYKEYANSTSGIKIANCGQDENEGYHGGEAGDQSKEEWYVRSWSSSYDSKNIKVFRHPDDDVRSMISEMATAAANNEKIGYDQNQRLTFWTQLSKAKYYPENIKTACEADCSSSTAAIVRGTGYRLNKKKLKSVSISMTTSNETSQLSNAGFKVLSGGKSKSEVIAGDILLFSGHTNIVVGSDEYDSEEEDEITLNLSYDRTTDPLLVEFGYAKEVSKKSNANLGSYLKAQSDKTTYPISAVNMADLLLDIFDIWGYNVSSSSSDSDSQIAGKVTSKSGKVLTSGTKIEIPDSITQTGLIADYTIYPNINWSKNTTQRTIFNTWKNKGSKSSHNIATLDGYYLIALTSHVGGSVGNIVEIYTKDGTIFQGIMADAKSSSDSDSTKYGHSKGTSGISIVEWEIMDGVSHSKVNQSLEDWGIYGKKVDYVVQYGTWLQ